MTWSIALELLGYFASALIAISLMMRSVVRLRLINLMGAATFSLYGFLIGSYPVGILNMMTASINVVQLIRLRRRREIFRILEVRPESQYLRYFLEVQGRDIVKFVPSFKLDPQRVGLALFILRDLVPAGLVLGDVKDGCLHVDLDYAIPQYRDLKIARYLFHDCKDFFFDRGIREIVSPSGAESHRSYLERMGFVPAPDGQSYRLVL